MQMLQMGLGSCPPHPALADAYSAPPLAAMARFPCDSLAPCSPVHGVLSDTCSASSTVCWFSALDLLTAPALTHSSLPWMFPLHLNPSCQLSALCRTSQTQTVHDLAPADACSVLYQHHTAMFSKSEIMLFFYFDQCMHEDLLISPSRHLSYCGFL